MTGRAPPANANDSRYSNVYNRGVNEELPRVTMRRTCKPHPANAPGDFYVEDGCCVVCGMPEQEAPDIFGWAGPSPSHCVVMRQPRTPAELSRTFNAMRLGDLDCIRDRGSRSGYPSGPPHDGLVQPMRSALAGRFRSSDRKGAARLFRDCSGEFLTIPFVRTAVRPVNRSLRRESGVFTSIRTTRPSRNQRRPPRHPWR